LNIAHQLGTRRAVTRLVKAMEEEGLVLTSRGYHRCSLQLHSLSAKGIRVGSGRLKNNFYIAALTAVEFCERVRGLVVAAVNLSIHADLAIDYYGARTLQNPECCGKLSRVSPN
jgi:hypothetical protein